MILSVLAAAAAAAAPAAPLFDWRDRAVYQVSARPERVTDIALEPGEVLSPVGGVAAGDTVRWIVGDSESGAGAARQVHILVKPTGPDLATNLVIATDRRTYHLELRSGMRDYMAEVAWRYPAGALIALRGPERREPQAKVASVPPPSALGADLGRLDFNYRVEGNAPWRPERVFSDGRQTAMDFPSAVAAGEMPPLFIEGTKAEPELVNYRVQGRRLIVDRIFQRAELRLGAGDKATVVHIIHVGEGAR